MTNLLRDYITVQLGERVSERRVVVWYDPRSEFTTFIAELRGPATDSQEPIDIAGAAVHLARYDGSFYALRLAAEPFVAGDEPQPLILYLPGLTADVHGSVLMELELAGCRWEPKLRQVARNAMRQRFTDGAMDDILGREKVTYEELVAILGAEGEGTRPSLLRSMLPGASSEARIASWLADAVLDDRIVENEAATELQRLVAVRLGFDLGDGDLSKWRAIVVRHVLSVEFRGDIAGDLPGDLERLPASAGDSERNARAIARILRDDHAASYPALADRAARELKLDAQSVDALQLGSIDTFRFEEGALLDRCAQLVVDGSYQLVTEIAAARQGSFWLQEAISRQAQWEAIRLAAELGLAAEAVISDLAKRPAGAASWVTSYADRWHAIDRAQRHLEAWLPKLDDESDEHAIAAVRLRYDDAINRLAEGFVAALQADEWSIHGQLQQTSIYEDVVRPQSSRVAYFLVDAMRYEMGAELAERLATQGEVSIRPAIAVLPSITPMGMAALMPGAASSYNVADRGGRLMAQIGGTDLADLRARKKYLAARVASSVDLELGEVLALVAHDSRKRSARAISSSFDPKRSTSLARAASRLGRSWTL